MIDFILKVGENVRSPNREKLDFLFRHYKKEVEYNYDGISLSLFYGDETADNFLETEDYIFFVIGYIFPIFDCRNILKAKSVSDYYQLLLSKGYRYFLNLYKGNYTLVLVDKKNKSVSLINSILSTNFIFYTLNSKGIIVSSSLWLMLDGMESFEIDTQALIEISIFDYVLGDKTLIKKVHHLEYADIVHLRNNPYRIVKEKSYDFQGLITSPESKSFLRAGKADLIDIMRYNIKLIIDSESKCLFPITGGLDSRLNLSLVESNDKKKIITYTYGMEKSVQFAIAQKVVSTLELEHIPVYLNNEFTHSYPLYAENAILLSSGYAPYMRANFYYAFSKLQQVARACVSGVFGSELIRPMHLSGGQSLNYSTVRLFAGGDHLKLLNEIFEINKRRELVKASLWTAEIRDKIYDYLRLKYFARYHTGLPGESPEMSWKEKLFLFHLEEGMRKFFMEELSIEKYFVRVYTPYLDFDFVSKLFLSDYAGLYNGIFEESLFKRRKGQYFYADVLKVIAPHLAKIKTDRGIKPEDLHSIFGWLKVMAGYFYTKMVKTKIVGNDTYNQNLWDVKFFNHCKDRLQIQDEFFNISLKDLDKILENGHSYEFSRHLSLKLWLDKVYQLF